MVIMKRKLRLILRNERWQLSFRLAGRLDEGSCERNQRLCRGIKPHNHSAARFWKDTQVERVSRRKQTKKRKEQSWVEVRNYTEKYAKQVMSTTEYIEQRWSHKQTNKQRMSNKQNRQDVSKKAGTTRRRNSKHTNPQTHHQHEQHIRQNSWIDRKKNTDQQDNSTRPCELFTLALLYTDERHPRECFVSNSSRLLFGALQRKVKVTLGGQTNKLTNKQTTYINQKPVRG